MACQGHASQVVVLLSALTLSALLHAALGSVANKDVAAQKGSAAVEMNKLRFERLPCSCQTKECGCCATIKVQRFNFSQRGCLNFSVDPGQLSMMMNVYLNNKSVYQQQVSGRNPPPFCVPVPQFPLLMLCARVYDVRLDGSNVHACVNLEVQLQATPLLVVSFDCVRFGADGFAVEKPLAGPATSSPAADDGDPRTEEPRGLPMVLGQLSMDLRYPPLSGLDQR